MWFLDLAGLKGPDQTVATKSEINTVITTYIPS